MSVLPGLGSNRGLLAPGLGHLHPLDRSRHTSTHPPRTRRWPKPSTCSGSSDGLHDRRRPRMGHLRCPQVSAPIGVAEKPSTRPQASVHFGICSIVICRSHCSEADYASWSVARASWVTHSDTNRVDAHVLIGLPATNGGRNRHEPLSPPGRLPQPRNGSMMNHPGCKTPCDQHFYQKVS